MKRILMITALLSIGAYGGGRNSNQAELHLQYNVRRDISLAFARAPGIREFSIDEVEVYDERETPVFLMVESDTADFEVIYETKKNNGNATDMKIEDAQDGFSYENFSLYEEGSDGNGGNKVVVAKIRGEEIDEEGEGFYIQELTLGVEDSSGARERLYKNTLTATVTVR